jgi:hypothetical protein
VRLLLKLPWLCNFPAHLIAFGPRRVRVARCVPTQ